MISNMPAKKVFQLLVILVIVTAFVVVFTDKKQFMYVAMLIGGIIGIVRPKILLEYLQDENKNNKLVMDPLFSEKFYKVLGFCGGLFLIIFGTVRLFFNH